MTLFVTFFSLMGRFSPRSSSCLVISNKVLRVAKEGRGAAIPFWTSMLTKFTRHIHFQTLLPKVFSLIIHESIMPLSCFQGHRTNWCPHDVSRINPLRLLVFSIQENILLLDTILCHGWMERMDRTLQWPTLFQVGMNAWKRLTHFQLLMSLLNAATYTCSLGIHNN